MNVLVEAPYHTDTSLQASQPTDLEFGNLIVFLCEGHSRPFRPPADDSEWPFFAHRDTVRIARNVSLSHAVENAIVARRRIVEQRLEEQIQAANTSDLVYVDEWATESRIRFSAAWVGNRPEIRSLLLSGGFEEVDRDDDGRVVFELQGGLRADLAQTIGAIGAAVAAKAAAAEAAAAAAEAVQREERLRSAIAEEARRGAEKVKREQESLLEIGRLAREQREQAQREQAKQA